MDNRAGHGETRLIGLAGWSGAGKTTLIERVIPLLREQGLKVSTLKHAHHAFDIDVPGKDSWRHRQAGAGEVLVASGKRWALLHELDTEEEPSLADLLPRLAPCDLVIAEGWRRGRHPKVEVWRAANERPLIYPDDDAVRGFIGDDERVLSEAARRLSCAVLADIAAVASLLVNCAVPVSELDAEPAP